MNSSKAGRPLTTALLLDTTWVSRENRRMPQWLACQLKRWVWVR